MAFGNQSKTYLEQLVRQGNNSPICVGYEKLSISTVKSLTIPDNANFCQIALESDVSDVAVRYNTSGDTPTSTDGMPLANLDRDYISSRENMVRFKAIQTGAGTHTLHIEYFK